MPYTPGPWRAWSGSGAGHPLYIIAEPRPGLFPRLAQMTHECPSDLKGNAALMAAAPDLLAACTAAALACSRPGPLCDQLNAAIAKADGR